MAPTLIILLIAAAIGGYLIYAGKANLNQTTTQVSKPPQTPVDETASWKIYTNTKDGYSIKYPSNVSYQENDSEVIAFKGQKFTTFSVDGGMLTISSNGGGMGLSPIKSVPITVGGVKSIKYYQSESHIFVAAIFSPNGNEIGFEINLSEDLSKREKVDNLFDQILSTFKFQ